jgi:aminodeoxyfutalosine deaminase
MLLRSRILVPVTAPPIDDGGVWVCDGRIAAAGKWADVCALAGGDERVDLGNTILLPGLVNAHAHLEYTGMAGQFTGANGFAHWIRSIVAARQTFGVDAATEHWLAGASLLVESGTTMVADIQTTVSVRAAKPSLTPLSVVPFIEMTGVISRRAPADLLAEAETFLSEGPLGGGFSPHSPYATMPGLLEMTATRMDEHERVTTIHVAESAEEFEMFVHRRGPLYELIAGLGRPMEDCDGRTPLQHVARCGLLKRNALVVHANYLADEDLSLLANSMASVVHCPGSHAFFDHQPFRYDELVRREVNICLGTDSLASMNGEGDAPAELNMLTEMRRFQQKNPRVSPREILAMATINGAIALGIGQEAGSLHEGVRADLIAIPYAGDLRRAEECIVSAGARVEASFIGGRRIK